MPKPSWLDELEQRLARRELAHGAPMMPLVHLEHDEAAAMTKIARAARQFAITDRDQGLDGAGVAFSDLERERLMDALRDANLLGDPDAEA